MNEKEIAKEIISKILYITLATVSKEGKPWNTPLYYAFDSEYNFYWLSDQNGQHSQNIKENSQVALVIYDSTVSEGQGRGVYVQGKAFELTDEDEIEKALKYLYGRKNKQPRQFIEFLGDYPRRVYKVVPEKFWVNGSEIINGNFIDTKTEVDLRS